MVCIGMGYTGEKLAEKFERKLQKLEENYRCFTPEHLYDQFQNPQIRIDAEKSAGFESANRKIHLQAK